MAHFFALHRWLGVCWSAQRGDDMSRLQQEVARARIELALVRALADEVEHYAPGDPRRRCLSEQLREREQRLADAVEASAGASPVAEELPSNRAGGSHGDS